MSLLDVHTNVDLGLDLAAPVDLAAAANLDVAAPIQAAASANLLSHDAQAVALSEQHGTIDQGISGSARGLTTRYRNAREPAVGAPRSRGLSSETACGHIQIAHSVHYVQNRGRSGGNGRIGRI